MDTLLAIDNGTQSVRAILFNYAGDIVAKERVKFEPYVSDRPGWAEQDVSVYWDAIGKACKNLWANGASPDAVRAVSLTTQRGTVVNLDKNGEPLRRAIVWLDQRKTYECEPIGGLFGMIFNLIGAREIIRSFQIETEANWIAKNEPAIWANTDKYLLLSGYLNYRLIGEFRDSIGSQVGYLPFDYKNHCWAPASDFKWQIAPFKREMLPDLIEPGKALGGITASASEHTGIPKGIPVIAAAADKACEVLGSGAIAPNIACLSYGTTATVNVTSDKFLEPRPLVPPYPAAIAKAFTLEEQTFRGFWMVSWFKQEFGLSEKRLAEERNVEEEELFDLLLNEAPPGSMGLVLQPFWSPGVRVPGPEAKGAIIGFGDVHKRAHLYRAIIEGLAYAMRAAKEHLESRSGVKITEVKIAGGGAQSDAVMQITADVFGMKVSRPQIYEASALGAAINAAIGLKIYPDYQTAINAMTRSGKSFEPNAEHQSLYEQLYSQVYCDMYKQLKPLYHRIRAITKYPPPL